MTSIQHPWPSQPLGLSVVVPVLLDVVAVAIDVAAKLGVVPSARSAAMRATRAVFENGILVSSGVGSKMRGDWRGMAEPGVNGGVRVWRRRLFGAAVGSPLPLAGEGDRLLGGGGGCP